MGQEENFVEPFDPRWQLKAFLDRGSTLQACDSRSFFRDFLDILSILIRNEDWVVSTFPVSLRFNFKPIGHFALYFFQIEIR